MSIFLRPHHGMCFQFYEGKGYDADFTDHMGKILKMLSDDPTQPVTLMAAADAVCADCPNLHAGICADREKVERYDEAVLRLCGLSEGETIPYGDFVARVKEKILDGGLRKRICGDCCWNAICAGKEEPPERLNPRTEE